MLAAGAGSGLVSKSGLAGSSKFGSAVACKLSVESTAEGKTALLAGFCATAQLPKHNAMTLQ